MSKEISAILINVVSGLLILFLWQYKPTILEKMGKLIDEKWHRVGIFLSLTVIILFLSSGLIWMFVSRFPKAEPVFSDFEQGRPINNYGCHWGIFNDNPYNGNSMVSIRTPRRDENEKPSKRNDQYYAEIPYMIGDSKKISIPHCGVMAMFSEQFEPRDISDYNVISIDVWHEGPTPPEVRFFIQIVPCRIFKEFTGFYRYDFTDNIKTSSTTINIPFTDLKRYPDLGNQHISFNTANIKSEVLQIAVVIEGRGGIISQGRISFDNIRFK